MNIKKSIEDLPRSNRPTGNPPSSNNFVVAAVAQEWERKDEIKHERDLARAIPEAGPYRASYASKRCNRQLFYSLRGVEQSNPPSLADYWRFALGHTVHEMLQEVIVDAFPEAEAEVDIDLRPIGIPGSAHADLVMEYKGRKVLVEIKSVGGYKFKLAATTFHGPAEGPSSGHVLQTAMSAKAHGCDSIVIAYLSLENVSPNLAKSYGTGDEGRFAAEWHYEVQELDGMLATETERINNVLLAVNNPEVTKVPRQLVDTDVPKGAIVNDPSNGGWVLVEPGTRSIEETGSHWMCGYCEYRDRCISDGA